jgi:hypothetical protein
MKSNITPLVSIVIIHQDTEIKCISFNLGLTFYMEKTIYGTVKSKEKIVAW